MRRCQESLKVVKATLIISILSVASDYFCIFRSKLISGIDAYYYLLQINSITTYGIDYFSIRPAFTILYLTGLSYFLDDPLLAVKLIAVLLHLSLGLALFSITHYLNKSIWFGIVAFAVCIISGLHRYMVVEYISYLGAVSFLAWATFFWIRYFAEDRKLIFAIAGLLSLVIAIGSHKSAVPLILLSSIMVLLSFHLIKAFWDGNKTRVRLVLLIFFCLFISPAVLSLQPFFILPGLWRFEISAMPQFPATLSTFPELFILFLGSIAIFAAIFVWKLRQEDRLQLIVCMTLAASSVIVSLNPFISSQYGFANIGGRLRVLAYIQAALIIPCVVWLFQEKLPKIKWIVAAIVVPLMVWSFLNPLPLGAQPDYLARRERLIGGLQTNLPSIGPNSIIVAPHGEQFVVTYVTGIPSQQSFPKDNYESVYWLLNLVPTTFLDSSMHVIAKDKVGTNTILVKDGPAFRQRLQSPEVRQLLRFGNRHLDIYLASFAANQ